MAKLFVNSLTDLAVLDLPGGFQTRKNFRVPDRVV